MKILKKLLTLDEFKKYIKGKNFQPNEPNDLLIHHTWKPTQDTWRGAKTIDALKKYYEDKGWNAGPHIFSAPDGIWLFTDMNTQGIHAGDGNYRSIGIEVVGDYDGAVWTGIIKRNTLGLISALIDELGLKFSDVKFHSQFSSKTCPGKMITKKWLEEKLINYRKAEIQIEDIIAPVSEDKTDIVEIPVSGVKPPQNAPQSLVSNSTTTMNEERNEILPQEDIIDKLTNLIKNYMKGFLKMLYDNKVLKLAAWNALGAFLSVLAVYLGDLDPQYNIVLVPVILALTKFINKKFLTS